MNIPHVIIAVSSSVSITALCFFLYYSRKTMQAAASTKANPRQVEANLSKLHKVQRADISQVTPDLDCTRLILVYPQFPDNQGLGKIVGWKLPAGRRLEDSLLRTFWGAAAKKTCMTALIEPDGFVPPATAEFQSWDGAPQWFRATVSSEEAEKLIAELLHYHCDEPIAAHD